MGTIKPADQSKLQNDVDHPSPFVKTTEDQSDLSVIAQIVSAENEDSDNKTESSSSQILAQIQQVLDGLQSYISSHGGKVEFVELKDCVVFIRFYGTCLECPLSFYTLTYGIERHIKAKIPSILRVEALE